MSKSGSYFETFHAILEFMKSRKEFYSEFTNDDLRRIRIFHKHILRLGKVGEVKKEISLADNTDKQATVAKSGVINQDMDWDSNDITLPFGWKSRQSHPNSNKKILKSPDGSLYGSRQEALKFMISSGKDLSCITIMDFQSLL